MMWWCSPNITQSPFTSPGAGQHLICWFYTCKNNVCLFVIQQTISGESGGEGAGSESGGGVDLLIPQSSNMRFSNWKVNTRSHQRSAWGKQAENPALCRNSTHSTGHKEWNTIPALGHFPPYPSPSCLGLSCHELKANSSQPLLLYGLVILSFYLVWKFRFPQSVYRVTPFE